jgi:hypothetical protein
MNMKFLIITVYVFLAEILAFLLSPVAALTADKEGRLLGIFRWMETFDNLGWEGPQSEPAVKKYFDKSKKLGLMIWLIRNKAYTLRAKFRALPDYATMQVKAIGNPVPPKFGPWYWKGVVKDRDNTWFNMKLGFGFFGIWYSYLNIGWKLGRYLERKTPTAEELKVSPVGIFIGVSLRSDDWDEFK